MLACRVRLPVNPAPHRLLGAGHKPAPSFLADPNGSFYSLALGFRPQLPILALEIVCHPLSTEECGPFAEAPDLGPAALKMAVDVPVMLRADDLGARRIFAGVGRAAAPDDDAGDAARARHSGIERISTGLPSRLALSSAACIPPLIPRSV